MSLKKQKQIVILGGAGTGLQMADSISRNSDYLFLGFLDDDSSKQTNGYENYPVLGCLSDWKSLSPECFFITSLHGAKKQLSFFRLINSLRIPNFRWQTIIDPNTVISNTVKIGYGTYIGPGCILQAKTTIGNHCALLGNVYIGHQGRLGDYITCANSVSVGGNVSIADSAFIGANSTIREYIKIESSAIVGIGSAVVKNVPSYCVVTGVPAKIVGKAVNQAKVSEKNAK